MESSSMSEPALAYPTCRPDLDGELSQETQLASKFVVYEPLTIEVAQAAIDISRDRQIRINDASDCGPRTRDSAAAADRQREGLPKNQRPQGHPAAAVSRSGGQHCRLLSGPTASRTEAPAPRANPVLPAPVGEGLVDAIGLGIFIFGRVGGYPAAQTGGWRSSGAHPTRRAALPLSIQALHRWLRG